MKKIDKLLLSSFLPPFIMNFFIAMFVLVMIFLWKYIDEIMGKGAGIDVLAEMIFYMSMSLVPMSMSLAILIAAVMVMGNLAEQYELSSMKSAGVSLLRVMRPLMYICAGLGLISLVCSEFVIPVSNLKFKSTLHDLKNHKSMFNPKEGIFNDEISNFIIRVGEEDEEEGTIKDVLIYTQDPRNFRKINRIHADSGKLGSTGSYLVMELYDGQQFQSGEEKQIGKKTYPFTRVYFDKYEKILDLSEFFFEGSDPSLYDSHYSMMNSWQLVDAVDSMYLMNEEKKKDFASLSKRAMYFINNSDSSRFYIPLDSLELIHTKKRPIQSDGRKITSPQRVKKNKNPKSVTKRKGLAGKQRELNEKKPKSTASTLMEKKKPKEKPTFLLENEATTSFVELIPDEYKRECYRTATTVVRNLKTQADITKASNKRQMEQIAKHVLEQHKKYNFALICIVFLFIGAPMGAIVRKGGFGWPILIAIIFFLLFVVIMMFGEKFARTSTIPHWLGQWLPVFILSPVGAFLTFKAMNDSKILDMTGVKNFFEKLFKKKNGKGIPNKETL